jgi:hypothetical protein
MWKVVTLIALVVFVILSVMQPAVEEQSESYKIPPRGESFLLLGLGDRRVAADLVWLSVVQHVGSQRYVNAGLPNLEAWIDVCTDLDPRFESMYFVASAFLTALPERTAALDALLSKGERALPDSPMLPMARGFLHYFGVYEPEVAARHFQEATRKGAPQYLNSLADRLLRLGTTCKNVGESLHELQRNFGASATQARATAFECSKRLIEAAAATQRLQNKPERTFEQLRADGKLPGVVQFPGECWQLQGGKAWLEPCK